jgi:hypothetical protein
VNGRIITAEKDTATSDPAMVVVRRELMFTSPLAAPEFAVLEELPQDFSALCWCRPKCDHCVSVAAWLRWLR